MILTDWRYSDMELLLRYPNWKDRALTFSYDDGTEQDA